MRVLWASLVIFLAACCSTRGGQDDDRSALWNDVARPSVKITQVVGGSGSGVVIYQDKERALIITAAHVVRGESPLVVTRGDQAAAALVVRYDEDLDLAIISTPPIWGAVAYLARDRFSVGWGARIVAFGHPLGEHEGVLTDGRVTSVNDDGHLRYSAPTFFGNSGGGVFMMIEGRWALVSIAQRMGVGRGPHGEMMPYSSLGQGARPDVLYGFLREVLNVR